MAKKILDSGFIAMIILCLLFSFLNLVGILIADEEKTYWGTTTLINGQNYDYYYEKYGEELFARRLYDSLFCVDDPLNCLVKIVE